MSDLDWFLDVVSFHRKMGAPIGSSPAEPDEKTRLRRGLFEAEELRELREAESERDLPGVADAIVDLIYVLIGRAIEYGIDLRPIWNEVHRANMAKEPGGGGKAIKPEGWIRPDIGAILDKQPPIV